jgi:hypothetical protein
VPIPAVTAKIASMKSKILMADLLCCDAAQSLTPSERYYFSGDARNLSASPVAAAQRTNE